MKTSAKAYILYVIMHSFIIYVITPSRRGAHLYLYRNYHMLIYNNDWSFSLSLARKSLSLYMSLRHTEPKLLHAHI